MNSMKSGDFHYLLDEETLDSLKSFKEIDDVVHQSTEGSKAERTFFRRMMAWIDVVTVSASFGVVSNPYLYHHPSSPEVVEFLRGKSIFITGATGFVGKVLLEKLLRSCRDIEKIYILMRGKKDRDVTCRTEKLLEGLVFSELKKIQPNFREKVISICGDLSSPKLGISEENQEMLRNNVNIIFHVAATVKLDETLINSVKTNLGGTISLVDLAKSCKHLEGVVHVSTAYSNCTLKNIEEKVYVPPITDDQLLEMLQSLKGELNEVKRSLRKWPSSYIVAKNIAEYVIATRGKDLPVCILRPAIVTSTAKEPIRGYVDNYNGTNGVLANIMAGVMRTVHGGDKIILENVPVDFVVNAMIVAAQKTYTLGCGNIRTYNFVTSVDNPILISDFLDMGLFFARKTPTVKSLWYPVFTLNANFHSHFLCTVFYHYIPAILFDCYHRMYCRKPWMFSFYKKVYKFNKSINFFGSKNWNFATDNVRELWNELSPVDKKVFPFSMSKNSFNWKDYMKNMVLGIRLYLLKDDLETLPQALLKHKKLYYWHYGSKYAALCSLIVLLAFFKNRVIG